MDGENDCFLLRETVPVVSKGINDESKGISEKECLMKHEAKGERRRRRRMRTQNENHKKLIS